MKRFAATAGGRVRGVGYREHVYNKAFDRDMSVVFTIHCCELPRASRAG